MAQIVTITNPLTGQPAQVDQLEHTAQQIDDSIGRALPGGEIDTLLARKAPAGYGWGAKTGKRLDNIDLDTVFETGVYLVATGCTNTPSGTISTWSKLIVKGERACVQEYYPANGSDTGVVFSCYLRRIYNDETSSWGAWEWVNPPMKLGVEYRTTERYQGKPVYVKLVNFGALPNATAKAVNFSIENNAQLLECKGFVSGGGVLPYSYPGSGVGTANVYTNRSSGNFGVIVSTDKDLSGKSAYFILKYTKTTD